AASRAVAARARSARAARRQATWRTRASSCASPAVSPALRRLLGGRAASPEHLGLDHELVLAAVLPFAPRGEDRAAHRVDALLDEPRILEIGEIGQAQHGRRALQLLDQDLEARPPDLAHLDR